jgi:hypothetical protein
VRALSWLLGGDSLPFFLAVGYYPEPDAYWNNGVLWVLAALITAAAVHFRALGTPIDHESYRAVLQSNQARGLQFAAL